jgi:ClpX C4-type zinc finger
VNAEKPLIQGVAAKICNECVTLCAKGVVDYRLARAVNAGTENVTRFADRARRPAPALEVVA